MGGRDEGEGGGGVLVEEGVETCQSDSHMGLLPTAMALLPLD